MKNLEWSTSNIYAKLLQTNSTTTIALKDKWCRLGYKLKVIWKNVHLTYTSGTHKDTHFKFLHRITETKVFLLNRGGTGYNFRQLNEKCGICGQLISLSYIPGALL